MKHTYLCVSLVMWARRTLRGPGARAACSPPGGAAEWAHERNLCGAWQDGHSAGLAGRGLGGLGPAFILGGQAKAQMGGHQGTRELAHKGWGAPGASG